MKMKSMYFFPKAKAAFFDLDDTLTDADTDVLWEKWRLTRSPRSLVEILWLLKLHWQYIHGRFNIHTYMRYQNFRMKKISPGRFREMAERFFQKRGIRHINPQAAELVEEYQRLEIPVVMITNQHQVIAEPFARHLGIGHILANRNVEHENRFGETVTPYCFGEGKVQHARGWCRERNIPLAEAAFYSDSHHDMPLLLECGYPVAVNPGPDLKREAEERGWPTMFLEPKTRK